ncbi:MAG: aspartate kinase [Halobacteria archaeon]
MSSMVVKFGGTSVGSGERIRRAAESIADEVGKGNKVCVVVSAMGNTTDNLLGEMEKIGGADEKDENQIVSMGERTSVRMFKAALENQGVEAHFVEPGKENWPIITDEEGELLKDKTEKKVESLSEDMEESVPVVCGFLGESQEGKVTTLGRGGSDTSAMILGNCLSADEVVIVTDVDGIMTGDPGNVNDPRNLDKITVDEMQDLSIRGAGVVAPSALRYKENGLNVRIVHHKHGDVGANGTLIEGEGVHTHVVEMRDEPLAAVTVAGRSIIETPNLLARLSSVLGEHDINIYGDSTGNDSMSFFVDQEHGMEAERLLHREVVDDEKFSSVSLREDVGMLILSGSDFIDRPGIIYEVVKPLYENNINIVEIISSVTSIVVFVDYNVLSDAFKLMEDKFEDTK